MDKLWQGLRENGRSQLSQRDYTRLTLAQRLGTTGVEAGEIIAGRETLSDVWIPGVEVMARRIFPQRQRGIFGELGRRDEGVLAEIGMWPGQWAAARMFATTAKGFHVHPPFIPEDTTPEAWIQRLFVAEPKNYALRPYDNEQWDVMYFLSGVAEMLLVDERAGMPRRIMRFIIEGDNHRGVNNVAVIIPPGVAHAIRAEGSEDVIMVYGTSTKFNPDFEGRIAADIENAELPADWERYLKS